MPSLYISREGQLGSKCRSQQQMYLVHALPSRYLSSPCKAAKQRCNSPALRTQRLLPTDCWILRARSYKSRSSVMFWTDHNSRDLLSEGEDAVQCCVVCWGGRDERCYHFAVGMIYTLSGLQERFCSSPCGHHISFLLLQYIIECNISYHINHSNHYSTL